MGIIYDMFETKFSTILLDFQLIKKIPQLEIIWFRLQPNSMILFLIDIQILSLFAILLLWGKTRHF